MKIVLLLLTAVFSVGSERLVGGFTEISVDDAGALKALDIAVQEHNKRSNNMYISGVREVRKVEVQVVEGILYKIHVIMGNTPCRKTSALKQCTVHGDSELTRPYECTFRVWQRPWLGETQVWEKCP